MAPAKLVIASRIPLHPSWQSARLSGTELTTIELGCLPESVTRSLLADVGVADPNIDPLVTLTKGHPLSLWIAVEILAGHGQASPAGTVAPRLAGDLASLHLQGLDPDTKAAVEALSVVRRKDVITLKWGCWAWCDWGAPALLWVLSFLLGQVQVVA